VDCATRGAKLVTLTDCQIFKFLYIATAAPNRSMADDTSGLQPALQQVGGSSSSRATATASSSSSTSTQVQVCVETEAAIAAALLQRGGSSAKRRRVEIGNDQGVAGDDDGIDHGTVDGDEEDEEDEESGNCNDVDNEYFESYDDLSIHALMLGDAPRVDAYLAAIRAHKTSIEGKVVMDVGAGSGILSMLCARYGGAKCVYAIEAAPGMARLARDLVANNGLEGSVQVVEGRVEEIELPEKVDVIISEWMGFYLVHESMLESVLEARDRFLKPGGVMLPDSGKIWAAPVENEELKRHLSAISSMHGLDLSPIGEAELQRRCREPQVENVEADRLLASPCLVADLGDLRRRPVGSTKTLSADLNFVTVKGGSAAGLAFWFDVGFGPGVNLCTSPGAPATHWKQTVVYFGAFPDITPGEELTARVTLTQSATNPRQYEISIETE